MTLKRKYIALFSSLIMIGLIFQCRAFAQSNVQGNCLEQIKKLYSQMYEQAKSVNYGTYYLNYQVSTLLNKKNAKPQESEVEIYSNEEKDFIISTQMEVYRDAKATVHIIPQQKKVYIYDGAQKNENNKLESFQKQAVVTDSLLKYCKVESAGYEIQKNGDNLKKIKLRVTEKGVKKFHITSMMFLLNKEENSIQETAYIYDEKSSIKEMKVKVNHYSHDYKTNKLNSSALDMVMKRNNKVLEKYKDFTLIDNRGKQTITEDQKQLAISKIKMVMGNK